MEIHVKSHKEKLSKEKTISEEWQFAELQKRAAHWANHVNMCYTIDPNEIIPQAKNVQKNRR
jgi:hypothetical protein